ncbi:MAG: hypothetical protein OXP70_07730, partial [Acidobacteriota bacterium]|nr:hypothetical protein [Acidobacteriota bacterium]
MRRSHLARTTLGRSVQSTARRALAVLLLPLAFGAGGVAIAAPPDDPVRVVIETDLGAIELEVDVGRAPVTASNFLRYLDGGQY